MNDTKSPILTVTQVAQRLQFSEWKVKRLLRSGELRGTLSGRWRVTEDAIAEWLAAHSNTAEPALSKPRKRRARRK